MEKLRTEIVDVENNNDSIKFTCLEREKQTVVEVKWHKGFFDSALRKIVPDDTKIEQVNEWCKEYFKLDLNTIHKAEGKKIDVYVYDTYCSFWKTDARFKKEDKGKHFETVIDSVDLNNDAIVIRYKWNGETYKTNYRFTQRVGDNYFINPQKKRRQFDKFEEKFGLPIERRDEIVGMPIKVEVNLAFGAYAYGEISVK